ncbi:MAG: 3-hydroxyacyl-CoA dehydrogenase NAD-binding domain-containing protein, partial [bacterium]
YRIARRSPKTKIGLPEVKLGILPGWGGTQRLPRLIGIQKALDYILTGRTVDARKALRDGLIDSIIPDDYPADYTREAALRFASEIQSQARREKIKRRREKSNIQTILLEKNALGRRILFDQAKKKTRATTKDHYPAPMKALSSVEQGINLTLEEGLAIEAKLLGECIVTDVSKSLVNVFQMTEELKKDAGAENFTGETLEFNRIAVLGAGAMGGGIAQLAAYYDKPVRMKDINLAAIGAGMSQASKIFSDAARRRRLKKHEAEHKLSLISGTTDYSGFDKTDLLIEAIIEDLEIKKKVFAEVDRIVPEHAVIASNTSSLPVTEMAKATKRPEKVAGLHFFNPVHKMPLVEVICGEKSSDETVASLVAFSRAIGKTPIVVKDRPGFLVNRILSPYMNEATLLLLEGQTIEHIDRAITAFGMPMGPLTLFDEVGIDVTYKVSKILEKAFGDKMQASPVIAKMYENDRYGKKNGKGFYIHKGKQKQADPAVYSLLGDLRKESTPLAMGIIQERC